MIENRHQKLQKATLEKVIKNHIGNVSKYIINDNKLYIIYSLGSVPVKNSLPDYEELMIFARDYYHKFDRTLFDKVVYIFRDINLVVDLMTDLNLKNSDVIIENINFFLYKKSPYKLKITNADKIIISGKVCNMHYLELSAEVIEFSGAYIYSNKHIDIDSKFISFKNTTIESVENISITSDLISSEFSSITAKSNLSIESQLFDSKHAYLNANNMIEIKNPNCEEITGVTAPKIIYNGHDISKSEGILLPKARKQLLDCLKQMKDNIDDAIEYQIQSQRNHLNNEEINNILKRKILKN